MTTKEESTKIVNCLLLIVYFMTVGEGALVVGHGPILKMQYFFSSSCPHWGMDQTN